MSTNLIKLLHNKEGKWVHSMKASLNINADTEHTTQRATQCEEY